MKQTYTGKEKFMYLLGMFGQNVVYQVIAAGLIGLYLNTVLCIPAFTVSVIILIARVWDALNDPMMGTIVDKTHTKWGKCKPYLIIFPFIIGFMTILCFINGKYVEGGPFAHNVIVIVWAAASYIIWGMLFTVCDIPLWGITSLMTEDENDRSKIIGLARVAAGFGGLGMIVSFLPGSMKGLFEKPNFLTGAILKLVSNDVERASWIFTVVIVTLVATILFELAGLGTKERIPGDSKDKRSIVENFKIMWNCKPFRQILISGIIRSPLQLLMILAVPLMQFYYLNNAGFDELLSGKDSQLAIKVGLIAIMVFIPQFTAMLLTPIFVRKLENKKIYNFYSIVGAIPYIAIIVVYFAFKGNLLSMPAVILTAICIGLATASMGGINVMQSIMIADCVDYEEYHNNFRPDGIFFSGQSFLTKLSGGIAALIQGIVYTIVGFSGGNVDVIKERLTAGEPFYNMDGGKYALGMFFLISIPIAVGMILSAIPMFKFAMSDKEHDRILESLVEKRRAAAHEASPKTEE